MGRPIIGIIDQPKDCACEGAALGRCRRVMRPLGRDRRQFGPADDGVDVVPGWLEDGRLRRAIT